MARTQVQTELIATNAISGTIIADNAITATHIAQNSISGILIPDSGITTTMIASNNVTAAKIVTNAIQTRHIADDQVTGDKLSNNITVAGTLTSTGAVTANAGVVVDNITIDGTEIDLSSGDLTLDVAGDIILDADGADLQFHDGATEIGVFESTGNDFIMEAKVQDEDILLKGNDGGSGITALTLDMSEAGAATFNNLVDATNYKIGGAQGSDGEVMTSTGSGVAWESVSGGPTSLTENNSIWLGNDPSSTTNSAEGNVAVGTTALDAITTGDNNVAIGYMALSALQIKDNNIAIGKDTLLAFGDSSSSSDGHNIAIGTDALTTTTNGSYNVAIGGGSQYDATGDYNVSTGMWSLYEVSTGGKNVAIGHKALYNMTTGSENVAVGYEALLSASSSGASANTAVGFQALKSCSSGTYNVAVGREALLDCAGGNYNVGIGRAALENVSSAEENVAVGYGAGNTWTTNGKNVALGHLAGETTGTTCVGGIWIGYGAGSTEAIDGGKQGQTVIGYGAQCGNVEQVVVIGKNMNSVGTNWISIGHSDDARVSINDSSGTAWTYPSDERMKENIADMPASAGLSFIKTLKPRTFTWRKKEDYDTSLVALRGKIQQDGDTTKKAEGTQYGFIAQEAKTAMEAAGLTADNDGGGYGFWTRDVSSGSGGMQGVSKEDLIPSLVKAIQELEARLAALE